MVDTLTTQETSLPLERELTPEYAARIIFDSFRFSQGDPDLQKQIFAYLHGIRPKWKISNDLLNKISKEFTFRVRGFMGYSEEPKPNVDRSLLHYNLGASSESDPINDEMLIDMEKIFNGEETLIVNVPVIARGVIVRDKRYLLDKGRPRTFHRSGPEKSEMGDPWLSHSIYYGVEEHATGLPEFDQMFVEVGEYLRNNATRESGSILYLDFAAVQKVYEEKSPHAKKSSVSE